MRDRRRQEGKEEKSEKPTRKRKKKNETHKKENITKTNPNKIRKTEESTVLRRERRRHMPNCFPSHTGERRLPKQVSPRRNVRHGEQTWPQCNSWPTMGGGRSGNKASPRRRVAEKEELDTWRPLTDVLGWTGVSPAPLRIPRTPPPLHLSAPSALYQHQEGFILKDIVFE